MTIYKAALIISLVLTTGCTWQDTAKFTANAAVYTAMIATGNAGEHHKTAEVAGLAAGDLAESLFDCSNSTE